MAHDRDIFDSLTAEQIHANVAKRWTFDDALPWLRQPLPCGLCGGRLIPRFWRFFDRGEESRVRWRCDVGAKCICCSNTYTFGLPVTKDVYDAADERVEHIESRIWWREAKVMLPDGFAYQEYDVDR